MWERATGRFESPAATDVSVVGLTVTGVHDHALVHDAAGIHAITSAPFVADVLPSAAGPAVTRIHALSLSMLLLVLLLEFLLLLDLLLCCHRCIMILQHDVLAVAFFYLAHAGKVFQSLEGDILHSHMSEKSFCPWSETF